MEKDAYIYIWDGINMILDEVLALFLSWHEYIYIYIIQIPLYIYGISSLGIFRY